MAEISNKKQRNRVENPIGKLSPKGVYSTQGKKKEGIIRETSYWIEGIQAFGNPNIQF
jgi:hypothetical protein